MYASLQSLHRGVALRSGPLLRYPADVAPFCAVAEASADVSDAVADLLAPGESTYMLGVAPASVRGARLEAFPKLAQMVCDVPLVEVDGPRIIPLGEAHRQDVLALTALVYPHYFRPRTMDLGRYFGIYEGGRLAAMIGERLGTDDTREISAVCTHPDFTGRGLARRLMAMLTNDLLARGKQPFLHVSHENTRAKAMYLQLGFRVRIDIPFHGLHRD